MPEQGIQRRSMLADFQVGVDNVIFSVDCENNRVLVLLTKRTTSPGQGLWSLPGTFVRVGESLEGAAYRVLAEKIQVDNLYLEQLYSFGDYLEAESENGSVSADQKSGLMGLRYLSVSYFALVRFETAQLIGQAEELTDWFPCEGRSELNLSLAFNHGEILRYGYSRLQNKVMYSPLAFDVLPPQFTLNDLFQFYCTILGADFTDYSNFRTRLLKLGFLNDTGRKVNRGAGRPATLYEFDSRAFLPFKDKPLVFV